MSIEKIVQALETETEHQIAEIEQAAQKEIEQIHAQAQAEATTVRQKRLAAVQAPLQAEQTRILNQAKLEALQIVLGMRESLINSALAATARHLTDLVTSEAYAQVLWQLTEEALDTLDVAGPVRLRVQDRDVPLMRRLVQEMELSAEVEGGLEEGSSSWGCPGGVAVTTADRRIKLVNTLVTRLQRVANLYRPQIADMLCGDSQEG
jgi:vacuolar-type H+-ATPase subunit E/Vma4